MIKDHPLKSIESEIKYIEGEYTVDQIIAWIKISSETYQDEETKLVMKNYLEELQNLLVKSQTLKYTTAEEAFKLLNIKWRY